MSLKYFCTSLTSCGRVCSKPSHGNLSMGAEAFERDVLTRAAGARVILSGSFVRPALCAWFGVSLSTT